MNRITINTSHGPVAIVGHVHTGAPRPTLLVISGAFPPPDYKHELDARFPGANVLIGLLPGMHCPAFSDPRVETYAAAYDEVIGLLLRDQPIVAYGVSTGCLVTAALASPNVRRQVLQEPFFSTAALWPFQDFARERLASRTANGELRAFLENVFGISMAGEQIAERDYNHLLDSLTVPTDVIVGQLPLEERGTRSWPSFASRADRQRLLQHPHTRIFEGPPGSGHHLEMTQEGQDLVLRVLHGALMATLQTAP